MLAGLDPSGARISHFEKVSLGERLGNRSTKQKLWGVKLVPQVVPGKCMYIAFHHRSNQASNHYARPGWQYLDP